jgi:hypothetical protein
VVKRKGRFLRVFLMLNLIGIAAALALPLVPLSPLKDEVQLRLSEALGRTVTIDSARLSLIPRPYIKLSGMTAQESPAFGGGIFVKADNVRADVDLIQYLRTRRFVLDSITFISPQINLVKNAEGVWSWTTIGKQAPEQAYLGRPASDLAMSFPVFSLLLDADSFGPAFKKISIENASARLIDRTGSQPAEALYKNIHLTALLAPGNGSSGAVSHATGNLDVQSDDDGEADLFKTSLPFDLQIARSAAALSIDGRIGPGRIESKNIEVGSLTIGGKVLSESGTGLIGKGKLSATDMFIRTINLSEQVGRALKIDQIGDMSSGTVVGSLETDFQLSGGAISTPGLRIQQLDGLGDATAQNGSFKIEAALDVNYEATITMSEDATGRVKAISSIVGMLVTILETDRRISVPINISGDVRKPEIQVDVSRIF